MIATGVCVYVNVRAHACTERMGLRVCLHGRVDVQVDAYTNIQTKTCIYACQTNAQTHVYTLMHTNTKGIPFGLANGELGRLLKENVS